MTLGRLSGDVWPRAADDDGLRGSKEGDDNVEDCRLHCRYLVELGS